ncbi:MAG: glycosyltransferase [Kiritimatiellae bacterium]|nr:glycosyltransferase [Kiritimatiellia bacterium]
MILLYVINVVLICALCSIVSDGLLLLYLMPLAFVAISTFPENGSPVERRLTLFATAFVSAAFCASQNFCFLDWYAYNTTPGLDLQRFTYGSSVLFLVLVLLCAGLCSTHLRLSGLRDRWALLFIVPAASLGQNGWSACPAIGIAVAGLLLLLAVRCIPPRAGQNPSCLLGRICNELICVVGVVSFVTPDYGTLVWPLALACLCVKGSASPAWFMAVVAIAWQSETYPNPFYVLPGYGTIVVTLILWLICMLFAVRAVKARIRSTTLRVADAPACSVSVVIPVINEAEQIAACLRSALQASCVCEAIVVDGGSQDETVRISGRAGGRVISNPDGHGRGAHILAGTLAARGDVVLVVHADTRLTPAAASDALRYLADHPHALGGAIGSVFDSPRVVLRFVEAANNLRAAFMGISFGDQIQFFKRGPAIKANLVPDFPLMEDVEISLRLQRYGDVAYCFGDCLVSDRSWGGGGARKRAVLVIRLVGRYLLQRMRGTPDVNAMYQQYYGDRSE